MFLPADLIHYSDYWCLLCYNYAKEQPAMKKLFGELNISWKRLIIFAVFIGVYTGVMAMLPQTEDTSFADISISFEVWILFGILIIVNSKTPKESAAKCFIFFLISQPIVYLVQVPFSRLGWQLFMYYPGWFVWTLLTIPMGYIGHYMKMDKWWGLLILSPVMVFLGSHYSSFLMEALSFFPNHLLSALFCLVTLIIYPLGIFHDRKVRLAGLAISVIIVVVFSVIGITSSRNNSYSTQVLGSNEEHYFDENYDVYLEDSSYGNVKIIYMESIETYMVHADFVKTGHTVLVVTSPQGEEMRFDLTVKRTSYDIERIKE